MKFLLNNTKYDKAIAKHGRADKASYAEIVALTLTDYEVKQSDKLIYNGSLESLTKQVSNRIANSGTEHSYNVSTDNTEEALEKLSKLGIISAMK